MDPITSVHSPKPPMCSPCPVVQVESPKDSQWEDSAEQLSSKSSACHSPTLPRHVTLSNCSPASTEFWRRGCFFVLFQANQSNIPAPDRVLASPTVLSQNPLADRKHAESKLLEGEVACPGKPVIPAVWETEGSRAQGLKGLRVSARPGHLSNSVSK